jgi:hypothetical protein
MVQQLVIPMLIVLLGGSPGAPKDTGNDGRSVRSQADFVVGRGSTAINARIPAAKAVVIRDYRLHRRSGTTQRSSQGRTIEDILADQALWGEGFPSALAALPALTRTGERRVWVLPDRIIGGNKYANREEADAMATKLAEELKNPQKPRSPRFNALIAKAVPLKAEVYYLIEDRSYRISAPGPQFLPARLSIADVRKRLGKEERVTTELLDDGTERRPVVLTLHHYAGGAIVFVESDMNPNIGSVDRVFLDAPKISATIF